METSKETQYNSLTDEEKKQLMFENRNLLNLIDKDKIISFLKQQLLDKGCNLNVMKVEILYVDDKIDQILVEEYSDIEDIILRNKQSFGIKFTSTGIYTYKRKMVTKQSYESIQMVGYECLHTFDESMKIFNQYMYGK